MWLWWRLLLSCWCGGCTGSSAGGDALPSCLDFLRVPSWDPAGVWGPSGFSPWCLSRFRAWGFRDYLTLGFRVWGSSGFGVLQGLGLGTLKGLAFGSL